MNGPSRVAGIGLGLRQALASELFASELFAPRWLEIHPENYLRRGGRFRSMLDQALARWPLVTHGLTLGFGAVEPAERSYTKALREFLREIKAPWHSEHLCFSGTDGVMLHDLLPLPFVRSSVDTACARIAELRDALELPIAIENISYYAHLAPPAMDEVDFLVEVLEGADAKLLLDVNNVFVNSRNHGFDPRRYVDRIDPARVLQIHVAGHYARQDGLVIDTHGEAVTDEVYELLEYTLRRTGPVPVLLERDQGFPAFLDIVAELERLHQIYARATGVRSWG